jgi:uncharacterized membrane protein YphA (DoxX/SURF4 family)
VAQHAAELSTGVLLVAGLLTPVAGALRLLAELAHGFETGGLDEAHILRAILAASLVVLGPGAWSVDARLFGRRRIDVGSVREE